MPASHPPNGLAELAHRYLEARGDVRRAGRAWLGATRIPTEAEVDWEGSEGRFFHWRATIKRARLRRERFDG